jgi:hypothetical protein
MPPTTVPVVDLGLMTMNDVETVAFFFLIVDLGLRLVDPGLSRVDPATGR